MEGEVFTGQVVEAGLSDSVLLDQTGSVVERLGLVRAEDFQHLAFRAGLRIVRGVVFLGLDVDMMVDGAEARDKDQDEQGNVEYVY